MNDREYHLMRCLEDSHWWYEVLHEAVADELLRQLAGVMSSRMRASDIVARLGGDVSKFVTPPVHAALRARLHPKA